MPVKQVHQRQHPSALAVQRGPPVASDPEQRKAGPLVSCLCHQNACTDTAHDSIGSPTASDPDGHSPQVDIRLVKCRKIGMTPMNSRSIDKLLSNRCWWRTAH